MNFLKKLKKLKGDDSSRVFYRKNNITAPKLLSENYSKNYIEIQDFGDETIFKLFNKKKINKISIYKNIINLMNRIQSVSQKKIINFKNQIYKIPKYTPKILV